LCWSHFSKKKDIAQQLLQGVPKNKILDKIRTSLNRETGVDRLGLSHMQDIKNIARKLKINSDIKLDENDAVSVAATVRKL
jgi:Co/Zn/Cd efflux system component